MRVDVCRCVPMRADAVDAVIGHTAKSGASKPHPLLVGSKWDLRRGVASVRYNSMVSLTSADRLYVAVGVENHTCSIILDTSGDHNDSFVRRHLTRV